MSLLFTLCVDTPGVEEAFPVNKSIMLHAITVLKMVLTTHKHIVQCWTLFYHVQFTPKIGFHSVVFCALCCILSRHCWCSSLFFTLSKCKVVTAGIQSSFLATMNQTAIPQLLAAAGGYECNI